MIKVIGERLKQYDKNRKVSINPPKGVDIKKLTFEKNGIEYDGTIDSDGTALIHDALLISHGVLTVRCECVCDNGYKRVEREAFYVRRAERPADYVKPSVTEKTGGGLGGVTSWNDLTDKPFGSEVTTITKAITDGEVEVEWDTETTEFGVVCESEDVAIVGDTYRVTLRGETYECVAWKPEEENNGYDAYIGNGKCYEYGFYGEEVPFLIAVREDWISGKYIWVMMDADLSYSEGVRTFTTKIEHIAVEETIKTIDEKYLPSGGVNIPKVKIQYWDGTDNMHMVSILVNGEECFGKSNTDYDADRFIFENEEFERFENIITNPCFLIVEDKATYVECFNAIYETEETDCFGYRFRCGAGSNSSSFFIGTQW